MSFLKRWAAVLTAFVLMAAGISAAAAGAAETGLEEFPVKHGSRESRKIAITMDDVNEPEWVWKAVDLCEQYGITMTFFPVGVNLHEEDRENWQRALDAGCEIGNHTTWHDYISDDARSFLDYTLLTFQEMLDRTLGYHYAVRWFRPPYGNIADSNGSMWNNMQLIKRLGYEHILLWDVSYMLDAEGAAARTQNGSILLFHARQADYECLEGLIPMLLEAGYEPVTVSALFGYDPPEAGGDMFVYDPKTYQYPGTAGP